MYDNSFTKSDLNKLGILKMRMTTLLVFLFFLFSFTQNSYSQCNIGSTNSPLSTPNSCTTYYRDLGAGQYEQITLTQGVTYSFDLSSAYLPNSSWSEHSVYWGGGVCINGTSNGNSVYYTAPATGYYNIGTNRITNGDGRYYFNYQSATLAYRPLQPNQPGGISGLTTVCSGSSATYSIGAASYAKDYVWEYSTDNANTFQPYTTGSTSINFTWPSVGNANGYIRVKSQNGPCSSAWTYLYVSILEQPTAPTTTTKSPNNNQVCINQQVSISAATGGVNQGCTIEYRHTIDGGNTWSAPYTSVPTGLSSAVSGNNRIQIQARRNSCSTSGCNTTSWNTIAMWHVDITPPTVLVHNVIVNLNAAGTYTLLPSVVDNGTTDNCTISTMTVSPSLFNCSNVGPNNVVLTVTDNAGNISTGNAVVTVKDVTPPNISVQNIFLALDMNGLGTITPAMINNGTTDACGIDTMYLSQYNFDCSHVGSNTVTLTVTDVNGNTSTSTATVLVQDLINPVVVTQDITVHLNANGVANITPPMIDGGSSDNCSYTLFTIPSTFNCANVGENTILVLAVDPGNNVVFNSAVVTVVDSIKPTITAPANLTVNANGSCVATGVQLGTPVTADNCSIATLTNNAPSSFPLGTTTVTWTVTDVNGNTRTATQTVTVVDNTDPTVSLPPLVTVNADANCGALNSAINFGLITNDNCTIASVVNNGPTTFPLGYSSIIWTITDNSGNSIQANQSILVVDNTPPTITTPPTVTVNANASCTATNVILGTPVTADNCQVVTVINNAPTSYSVGTTPVTWTVIDAAGNVTTAIQNVVVNDVTAPIISCPAAVITKNNTPGVCGYIVQGTEFNPTAADNCNQATITHNYSSWSSNTSLAGATLPVGTTVITWTATDSTGNTSTCTETITVVDNQAPTMVNCASGLTLTIGQYSCGSNPNWEAPQATDNCGVVSLTQTSGPSSTALLAVGSYTVVYTALDAAGNAATCSFVINVINSTAPVVVCPNTITNQSTDANSCVWTSGTVVNPIQAMGNCIALTWSITNPDATVNTGVNNATGYNFQKGTSTLTYTVTDNINVTATCSTQITVIDNTLPTITAPANITTPSNSTCQATGLSLGTPVTADNCSVASVTNNAPSSFPLGITTVTWTVTDGSGNIKTATQTVTVIDNQGPVINCPANPINRNNTVGTCEYTAVGNEFNISATDNCTLASLTHNYQASASNTSLAGSVFPVGTTNVIWTATDASGNVSTCTVAIHVVDNEAPTFNSCPSDISVGVYSNCGNGPTWTVPTASDNCSTPTITQTSGPAPGANLTAGTYTVTYQAVDASNNTATCSFVITVANSSNPIIVCPASVTQNTTIPTGCDWISSANSLTPVMAAGNCPFNITWSVMNSAGSITSGINDASGFNFYAGTNELTYTITDASNNAVSCTTNVIVIEDVNPTIVPPTDVTESIVNGCTISAVNLGTPVAFDNCAIDTITNNAPATFALGTTVVTWTVTDISGNSSTATQNVTIVDLILPTITAPANVTANANTSCIATGVVLGSPVTADNCSVASITNDAPATFALGTTTVTWTVTDGSGNVKTATQIVTVIDNINPTITAPNDVVVDANSACAAFNVVLGTPITADNCSVAQITNNAPTVFPLGTTIVTWTVTDGSGNTASTTQTVTVNDVTLPTIVAPANLSLNANANCTATNVVLGNPTTFDNCSIASVTNDAPVAFPLGNTTVTWTITDGSGNMQTASQLVTVTDVTLPTITAPANITLNANASCVATGVALGTPVTADNCSVASVTNNAPATFALGTTTITWTVTDGSGNVKTATQTVTVIDSTNPTITPPANVIVNANSACAAYNVALGSPVIADNCSIAQLTNNAPTVFPLGTTTVTWTVKDGSGNAATATQTVTVNDVALPTIVPPANLAVTTNTGCTATGVVLGNPITADNCSVATVTNNAPVAFPLGNTTVTWTVTDGSGNIKTATQLVTVTDVTLPTITAPANITLNANASCVATGVALGTPVTADNCSVASVTNNAPATFALGTTTITWTVTDGSGNVKTATQTVTVIDNTNPTITPPANVTVNANSACAAFNVALGSPVTADNCSIAQLTNNAPTVFPLGTTTVTWTVKDGSGNTATTTQTVTVNDVALPTIVPPANLAVTTNTGCTATGVVLGNPITADNCSVATVTNNAPVAFPLGNTTVTWTVTDGSGNIKTATQLVTVTDVTLPTITAPANITLNANASCVATGVALGTPVTADNCTVASVTNNAPATFTLGTTTITWTVTDGSGNVKTATQTVTVIDNTNPTITPPANVIVNANSACAAFNVALGSPVTADNCSIAQLTNNAPTVFPLGTTTVTWTVKDGSGNTATATQTVTVNDVALPTIVPPANLAVTTNTGCTATGVVLGNPITADNCSVATVTNNAPVAFPLGNTTVTWTVTDGSGNVQTATQLVTVTDVTLPTITAPANITLNANASCAATGVALGTPVTADNCTVASVTNNAPATFALGTTTITWTVTDGSGNVKTAIQTVTVVDNVNPTITAPIALIVNTNNGCSAYNVALGIPVTFDNCSIASISNDAPNIFPLGNTTVTWTITDAAGNSASATQLVTVVDNIAPVIFAPTDIITYSNANCQVDNLVLGTPVTSDNCSIASITNNAPAIFNYGSTTVTWTIVDGSGNVSTATQLVSVYDSIKPTAVLNDFTITLSPNGPVAITVADVDNGSFDNCGIASIILSQYTFDCSNLGQTEVFVTITDIHGNKTESSVLITSLLSGIDDDFDGIDDACDESVNTTTVEVPDGFTPDGDNINDLFVIPGMDNYSKIEIEIFNRYGNSVYKNAAYQNDWNGTSSVDGLPLQDDTYFYVLILDGSLTKQGFVYINRVH